MPPVTKLAVFSPHGDGCEICSYMRATPRKTPKKSLPEDYKKRTPKAKRCLIVAKYRLVQSDDSEQESDTDDITFGFSPVKPFHTYAIPVTQFQHPELSEKFKCCNCHAVPVDPIIFSM